MSRPRRWRTLPAVALAVVLSGGCGVDVQRGAESLPSGALPTESLTTAPTSSSATPSVRRTAVYFVSGRGLEGVDEPIQDRSANGVLAALSLGPPPARVAELRTLLDDPLTGEPMLTVVSVSPSGHVVLASSDAYRLLPANDQVLLVGQVVLSLDEVGLSSVLITDQNGTPLSLSLPDGRVQEGPATADDYEVLIR
ncbi:MAG: hypothetical protein WCF04_12290 [Candidatus Nanopelagicales bacterium]